MSVQGDPGQSVRSVSGGPPWGEPDPWTSALWARADTVGGYAPPRDVPPPALPLPPDRPRRPSRQGLVVVEAMKMENEIGSPKAGRVKDVAVSDGQSVESGRLLVVVE